MGDALYGLLRRFGPQLRCDRAVFDNGKDSTPVYGPLYLRPSSAPSGTQAEGAVYFDDTLGCLMAYNGSSWVQAGFGGVSSPMTAGAGITAGVGTVYTDRVYNQGGGIIKTEIFVDLTGLNSGGADGDIIGVNSAASSHFGQVTLANNGLIFKGSISCAETPATGEPDIDVYTATESTGTEDAAISGLTETALLLNAADWTQGMTKFFTGAVVADQYLYLVASGGVTDATYTAGQFLIELWGYSA